MGKERSKACGKDCGCRENEGPLPVGVSMNRVGGRTHGSGENDGHEARPMSLVLGELQEMGHERDHHHASSHPHEAAEKPSGKAA